MKYSIKVGEKIYAVEIDDINARPVKARVDGLEFEVMPESRIQAEAGKEAARVEPAAEKEVDSPKASSAASQSPNPAMSGNTLTAPLPGTVTEIFVKAGDRVEAGQVVLVIEAMKMKNSIRSTWSGAIGEVFVSPGQTVAHRQALVKFADIGEAAWI
jgi:biotin carboxyl carrier protein